MEARSEAKLTSNLFLVLPVHQFATGEREFRWLLILRYPIVHIERSFVAVPFRADQHGPEKPGHTRFLESVEGRLGTTDSHPDHLVGAKATSFRGSDRSQHCLIVEPE